MTTTAKSNLSDCSEIRLLTEKELDHGNGGILHFLIGAAIGAAAGIYKAYKEDPGPDYPW